MTAEREGVLMGVELGAASTAEQDALRGLISDYRCDTYIHMYFSRSIS